jgi:CRP/FNR family transcriptional regulator, cyclic AMP receptor protein
MKGADLRSLSLFAGLSGEELEAVARWADEVDVEAGKHLVDEGRFAYEFFVIREGTADVVQGDDRLREMGAGDFFGEIGLLTGDHRRTASVVATSPMRVVVMTARDFAAMEQDMPAVAARVREALEQRSERRD